MFHTRDMQLDERARLALNKIIEEYELTNQTFTSEGFDGKTGEPLDKFVAYSDQLKIIVYRTDGALQGNVFEFMEGDWKEVKEPLDHLRNFSVEELLERIPDHFLSDSEKMEQVKQRIEHTIYEKIKRET